ncbi:peptidase M48 Ste24p [Streptomyces sp. IMTB 2501]|uniref:M56 family metallopeptidase n=1 Tax=Streptomyces sp. IMTB 2501 TaxID=1776340 RepID=UPI00096C0B95|nr:M56 family metallopeptidase [Streptomyces sp. IMTB 2501]OLZ60731.1 peptidase M48 Ste24p [Streptomyces sp. IMTB 2501]
MLISVYVPLAVTAVLTVCAPRLARRLAPRRAAWALACTALVTTVGWAGSLALLAFTGIAQIPEVAAEGRWSVPALRAEDPVLLVVAVISALVLLAGTASLLVAAVRQARHLLWARRECARLPGDNELAVVDDDTPHAFALPGAPGRIVVSRGMLRCLDHEEREAMLAHERAHLRGRHHVFQSLWRLAAALNPLLRPLADAGGFALERWADEEAAARVGSRRVVARAVGRAALASSPRTAITPPLAVTGGAVPQRVRALLAPPPPRRTLPIAGGALLLTLCCAGLANATSDSDKMLDDAQRAQCTASLTRPSASRPEDLNVRPPHGCCEHHMRTGRPEHLG